MLELAKGQKLDANEMHFDVSFDICRFKSIDLKRLSKFEDLKCFFNSFFNHKNRWNVLVTLTWFFDGINS